MDKLFDRFTGERRQFIVKENDLVEVMNMLNTSILTGCKRSDIAVNKREEAGWFINTDLTKNQWRGLLIECKNKKYQLVIKDDPDRMYFIKES